MTAAVIDRTVAARLRSCEGYKPEHSPQITTSVWKSFTPSKMDVPPRKPSRDQLRYTRYGVYDVAYEEPASPLKPRMHALLDEVDSVRVKLPAAWWLLADAFKIAPVAFVAYIVTALWEGVYCAINLYWLSMLFDKFASTREIPLRGFLSLVAYWLFCVAINVPLCHIHARSLEVLDMRFRAHFLPLLIRASMKIDVLSIQDLKTRFPLWGRFASEVPGRQFLVQLSRLIQWSLDVPCQVFILLLSISRQQSPEWEISLCLFIARGAVLWFAPSDGIGSSSYVYWPHNRHFTRMKTLYGLAFSTEYRSDLVLNGLTSSIESEYNKAAEELGDVDTSEPTPWRTDLRREWYWSFLMEITMANPLAMYALVYWVSPSLSSISSMVLLHQAASSISLSMGRYMQETPSLLVICSHAARLYAAIDYEATMVHGNEPYPRPIVGDYDAGMKISFRDVSLRYPGSASDAVHCVSFDVLPGELVLVVGANGSGKSTVLKLLAGLFEPSTGEVWVDDVPRKRYDRERLRRAVVFQPQVPVVYPGSVRENITLGFPQGCESSQVGREGDVEAAARMGGCAEWIARLDEGYETQLCPSFDVNNAWLEGMYGYPSEALKEELERHMSREASLSGGEKQRLATARTFMHLTDSTRLLLMDEATSAVDSITERTVLAALRQARAGKTVVLIAHRFHHLAHTVDRILCMKAGSVVECGNHDELMRLRGEYAALYHAQVDWVDEDA